MAKVLLVAENTDTRAIYGAYLAHIGHTILHEQDVTGGVRAVREHRPDLVLLTASGRGVDGFETARALKVDRELSGIPVVALTPYVDSRVLALCAASRCDGCVALPITPSDLAAVVERLLAPR